MEMIRYLSIQEAITIYVAVIQKYSHGKQIVKEAENFTVDMVNHKYTFDELVETIERHSFTLE